MDTFLHAARPLILDFLGSIFFIILLALKVDPATAAAVGVAVSVAVIAVQIVRRKPIAALQWLSLALVVISGAATMLTHDARFVMAKPSVIYTAVGVVMLQRGWMIRYIPPRGVGYVEDVTTVFGYVWSALMFVTAAANLVIAVWFTPWWVAYVGIFPVVSKIILFVIQFAVTRGTARRRVLAERAALAATAG